MAYNVLRGSTRTLTKVSKEGLLMPGVGGFVRWSLALGANIVYTDGKMSFTLYISLSVRASHICSKREGIRKSFSHLEI